MKCTKEKFFELLDLIEKNEISQKEAALIAGYTPPHFSRLLKRKMRYLVNTKILQV